LFCVRKGREQVQRLPRQHGCCSAQSNVLRAAVYQAGAGGGAHKTNGKAERFIQTALREWANAVAYPTSNHRAADLPAWLHRYNWHRPHGPADQPLILLGRHIFWKSKAWLPLENLSRSATGRAPGN